MDYSALTTTDKLTLAQQRLRGLESDHFNTALLGDAASPTEKSLNLDRETQIEAVKAQIAELDAALTAEQAKAAEGQA